MKHHWHKAPARGCTLPQFETHRFTVIRLRDLAERFTDRKPRVELCRAGSAFVVWDNRADAEVRP